MSAITTCPRCQKRVSVPSALTERHVVCPRCLASLPNPVAGAHLEAPGLNTDVRRDSGTTGKVLLALIAACVAGIILMVLTGPSRTSNVLDLWMYTLMFAFGALDVLVIVALLRTVWVEGQLGERGSAGRLVGFVLLSLILAVGVSVAVLFFFVVTCTAVALKP